MRIVVSPPPAPAAPSAPVVCAHCGARVSGQCAIFLHIGDNPPSGRPRVNVISQGFQFCGAACRDAWWDTATTDQLIPEHMHAEVASEHPLSATVFHCHDGNRDRVVAIETDDGATVAEQWGEVASQHAFTSHGHLEAWWRGEAHADDLPIVMIEGES